MEVVHAQAVGDPLPPATDVECHLAAHRGVERRLERDEARAPPSRHPEENVARLEHAVGRPLRQYLMRKSIREVIRGHQRSSEVIRGHQKPSEAIRAGPLGSTSEKTSRPDEGGNQSTPSAGPLGSTSEKTSRPSSSGSWARNAASSAAGSPRRRASSNGWCRHTAWSVPRVTGSRACNRRSARTARSSGRKKPAEVPT